MNENDKKIFETKQKAKQAIRQTELALKKHLSLVKKRERIASIVATIERLRGDLLTEDVSAIEAHLDKLNNLTKGFSDRAIQRKKQ